jgi:hypothetical protein
MKNDVVVLLRVYPKRGPQSAVDLVEQEYSRLLLEMVNESRSNVLHQVDIANELVELERHACLPGEQGSSD